MRLWIFAGLLLWTVSLQAQQIVVSGYVQDTASGEKLIGATVLADGETGTITNDYGFFSLSLSGDMHDLRVSYVGYETEFLHLRIRKDTLLSIFLSSNSQIGEVKVTGENPNRMHSIHEPGMLNIPMKMTRQLPVLMGEQDILKTLQLMPGVQPGSEGNTGLYVRGGEADNNLILVDGAEVFNPNHLFGFFSVFNSDAIKNVKLYTSAFPAQYNSRLASVTDIRMKDGNSKKLAVKGSVGLISSKLQVEGPVIKDRLTFILSARRTYLDFLAGPIMNHFTSWDNAGYYFFDLNGKIRWKLNERNSFYLSGYSGQ